MPCAACCCLCCASQGVVSEAALHGIHDAPHNASPAAGVLAIFVVQQTVGCCCLRRHSRQAMPNAEHLGTGQLRSVQ